MAVASCCKYFEEDVVYRLNCKGDLVFGLVLENSEFVSSDEEEEDKNIKDDEWDRVKKGHVRLAWHPKGDEEIISERKVHLADRSLMPSDVVRRVVKGRDTQRGYCRNVDVIASCQIVGSRQVIYNINSKDLSPLEEFSMDIAVFLDSWVGMVKQVKSKVYLKCFDGSKCILSSDDASDLDDVLDKRERGTEFKKYEFFPGQLLWGPVRCFENAEWLHMTEEMKLLKSKPLKTIRATVEAVKIVSIGVHWQCRAYTKDTAINAELQQPKYLVPEEDLKRVKMLNVFEPCTLQLGDRNYYKIKNNDLILTKEQWKRIHRETLQDPSSKNNSIYVKSKDEEENELSKVLRNDVDKEDENDSEFDDIDDDTDTASISSRSSISSAGKGKKSGKTRPTLVTKMLKNKKLKRARRRVIPDVINSKPGDLVVVETLSTSSKVEVVWQDGTVETNVPSTSLYPIHHLDDQEFFPGDFVVDNKDFVNPHDYGVIKKVDHNGRTALIQWLKTYTQGSDPRPVFLNEEEVSVYDLKDHSDFKYRPGSVIIRVANFENDDPEFTAGQVLDVHPNGKVEVSWVNNQRSFCYPQDLYKVGEYDSDDGELWDDGGESDDSWETESELSVPDEEIQTDPTDDKTLRPKLAENIERARASMAKLEEIFTQNPSLQTSTTMKQLIQVYKDCKYLDRLMGTTFFHESHFQGLLERVRDRGRRKCAQRVAEQVSRLFQSSIEEKLDGVCASLCDMTSQQSSSLCNGHAQPLLSQTNGIVGCETSEIHEKSVITDGFDLVQEEGGHVANICTRLCSLLKIQLLKAHEHVMAKFGKPNKDMNDDSPNSVNHAKTLEDPSKELGETTVSTDVVAEKIEEESPLVSCSYSMLGSAPDSHIFKLSIFQPSDAKMFFKAVRKEIKLLRTSLPEGIVFKGFDDRMDLYSVMIKGPQRTPYEDGLFFFDLQLSSDYPKSPPTCHFISYCSDRLNPNLYEDGKVCVSLLGTWGGKGTEVWTCTSNLLQVMVSIQGLILVSEPYFNEAGYERQKGTQQGKENSRMYNEMVILKLVQSMGKLLLSPPETFKTEIMDHFKTNGLSFIRRLEKWLEISEAYNGMHPTTPTTPTAFLNVHGEAIAKQMDINLPEFPLIPASKGFCITLRKTIVNFRDILSESFDTI